MGLRYRLSLQCFWETQPWSVSKKADETSLLCLYHSNLITSKPIFIQAFKGGNQINKSAQQTGTEGERERERVIAMVDRPACVTGVVRVAE